MSAAMRHNLIDMRRFRRSPATGRRPPLPWAYQRMEVPTSRIFAILGVPKATAEKKAAAGELVSGSGGQAAVGMIRLLGIAHDIVSNSTAAEAKTFDAARWLGKWIERPQAALGGRKPADLIRQRPRLRCSSAPGSSLPLA